MKERIRVTAAQEILSVKTDLFGATNGRAIDDRTRSTAVAVDAIGAGAQPNEFPDTILVFLGFERESQSCFQISSADAVTAHRTREFAAGNEADRFFGALMSCS